MNIIIEMHHPAHVHFFKNMIWKLEKNGHTIQIVTSSKDITLYLLNKYGFSYKLLFNSNISKFISVIIGIIKQFSIAINIKPHLLISRISPISGFISRIFKCPHITFSDTDHLAKLINLEKPLYDVLVTPECYLYELGPKHIKINSYKELAYLHPKYFRPDETVLKDLKLPEKEKIIILRLISWEAYHDVNQYGIRDPVKLLKELQQFGTVYITSEKNLTKELEKYKIKIPPEKFHDLLYYSTLYIGEGATIASEAALLGTPSIYISTLANKMGNFKELEEKYDLLYSFSNETEAFEKIRQLLSNNNLKQIWQSKRNILLKEKKDVTTFMIDLIENYQRQLL